jgi:hypothetical protein
VVKDNCTRARRALIERKDVRHASARGWPPRGEPEHVHPAILTTVDTAASSDECASGGRGPLTQHAREPAYMRRGRNRMAPDRACARKSAIVTSERGGTSGLTCIPTRRGASVSGWARTDNPSGLAVDSFVEYIIPQLAWRLLLPRHGSAER